MATCRNGLVPHVGGSNGLLRADGLRNRLARTFINSDSGAHQSRDLVERETSGTGFRANTMGGLPYRRHVGTRSWIYYPDRRNRPSPFGFLFQRMGKEVLRRPGQPYQPRLDEARHIERDVYGPSGLRTRRRFHRKRRPRHAPDHFGMSAFGQPQRPPEPAPTSKNGSNRSCMSRGCCGSTTAICPATTRTAI